jgi:hypothetical protein
MRDRFATHQLAGSVVASVWAVGFLDPHFLVTRLFYFKLIYVISSYTLGYYKLFYPKYNNLKIIYNEI